jgi:hypothetical protein
MKEGPPSTLLDNVLGARGRTCDLPGFASGDSSGIPESEIDRDVVGAGYPKIEEL